MSTRLTAYGFRLFTFLLILSFACALAPGTVAQEPVKAKASEVIIPSGYPIEIALAWSSDWPDMGYQSILDATEMAMDEYGPVHGFALKLNLYDSGCDVSDGANAAGDIVANLQNAGVVGPFCSISTEGAAPVFEANGVVMISYSNTRPNLVSYGPNTFNRVVVEDPDFFHWDQNIRTIASVKDWELKFYNRFGHDAMEFDKYAYDAATLLLASIEQVGQLSGGDLHIDRAELAEAVRNTATFSGVTGQIAIKANGDRLNLYDSRLIFEPFSADELDPAWSWVDGDPTHWSLAERPGFLRIITQQEAKNWLARRAPLASFEIRTHLFFTPSQDFQIAGLTVFQDTQNHLTFGRAYCDRPEPDCVGDGIYFDRVENGAFVGTNYATAIDVTGQVYLRLVRVGAEYTASFSTNGTEWIEAGSHVIGFEPRKVGLVARNQSLDAAEIPADFDYFVLTYELAKTYLPLAIR